MRLGDEQDQREDEEGDGETSHGFIIGPLGVRA
jgi:hypothetical protein